MVSAVVICFISASLAVFPTRHTIEAATTKTKANPNVVLIVADDYGFHDIGYHGSKIKTPVLDQLADEGVKLENYYVQPICTPTRSQLMTGRYQIHTGLQHGVIRPWTPNGLPLDEVTLPQKLKQYGYATHIVGKWHLGFFKKEYVPTNRGFDSFLGYYVGAEDYLTHVREGGLDFRVNEEVLRNYNNTYSTMIFADHAKKIIKAHNKDQPLFLYIPFQAVHAPLEAPRSYVEPYKTIYPDDESRQVYAGMVACMDEAIGNITTTLKSSGLYENTVIIFSTDNGGQVKDGGNNWPLRGWKDTLYEGGVRAVGFVHSPLLPKKVQGTINNQLIHVSDWFPTIVEGLAKGDSNGTKPLDGYNVWSSISENKASPRTEILHNIDPLTVIHKGKPRNNSTFDVRVRAALRFGDWKILTGVEASVDWRAPPSSGIVPFHPTVPDGKVFLLFNITADPNEYNDLSEKYPEVVDMMLEKLTAYNKTAVPCVYPVPDPKSDPKFHDGVWGPWR